jgi:transcriptional regulator with XRE-family HTH domain
MLIEKQLLRMLRERVKVYKNQSELARAIGISRSHMSRVVRGDKPIDGRVLAWLGYRAVTVYERKAP